MLAIERKLQIINILKESKKVLVNDLSHQLNVSDETIRKDLKELESNNLIIRSHGGAVLNNANFQPSFMDRETINSEAKLKIAKLAQRYIEDGMTIMVDTSTTSKCVIQNVNSRKNLTVITNSYQLINECSVNSNLRFIATGGEVKGHYKAFVGRDCYKVLSGYYADLAILGCTAISMPHGFMESNAAEADVKIAMGQFSRKTLIVADSAKFDQSTVIRSFPLNQVDYLITEKAPSQSWIDACKKVGLELTYDD